MVKHSLKIFITSVIAAMITLCISPVFSVLAQTPCNHNVPAKMKVTAAQLYLRSGPGTNYQKVGSCAKNQIVTVHGKMGSWYLVQLPNDVTGLCSGQHLTPTTGAGTTAPKPAPKTPSTAPKAPATPAKPAPAPAAPPAAPPSGGTTADTADKQTMLNLVNQARAQAGQPALSIDPQVAKCAQVKAEDMVAKNYFSHTSPTYGSPFDMMKKFGISYTYAGENLAGNSTVQKAHDALMNSPGHRQNILSPNYRFIGIGIQNSPTYGKIFVQQFINK